MKAGALSGSVEQLDLTAQSKQCISAGKKPISISVFAENSEGILALSSGRVDVWVGDSDQNAWLKKVNNGTIKDSGVPFDAAIDGIALLKGSPLVPVLQKAMQTLMDNGTYEKILANYGVQGSAISKATLDDAQY
jgi:polar amino acid transport system substrate-binding protein